MKYLSVASGIEAVSVAWEPLGMEPVAFAEIDKFPSAVLEHHYPHVPNVGDFTKIRGGEFGKFDVLVGGTPCQSFSVAGKRGGLEDPRGNLTLEFVELAYRSRPQWFVWENVPGVLSRAKGEDFRRILCEFTGVDLPVPKKGWKTSGVIPAEQGLYSVAWRILDAQYFGVPQRRRRLFLVGHLRDWRRAASVLLEPESLRGHSAPSRQTRQSFTHDLAPSLTSSGRGVARPGESRGQDPVIAVIDCPDLSPALKARDYKGPSSDGDGDGAPLIAHSLRADGFDASEDGSGRGTPIVAIQAGAVRENPESGPDGVGVRTDGIAYTLEARSEVQAIAFAQNSRDEVRLVDGDGQTVGALAADAGMKRTTYVAFSSKNHGQDAGDVSPTLRSMNSKDSNENGGGQVAIAYSVCLGSDPLFGKDIAQPITTCNGDPGTVAYAVRTAQTSANGHGVAGGVAHTLDGANGQAVCHALAVRRLTPRECERLQGFPDDWTLVPYGGKKKKPAADGPRYKAIGNSMAVPCMSWLGKRIIRFSDPNYGKN